MAFLRLRRKKAGEEKILKFLSSDFELMKIPNHHVTSLTASVLNRSSYRSDSMIISSSNVRRSKQSIFLNNIFQDFLGYHFAGRRKFENFWLVKIWKFLARKNFRFLKIIFVLSIFFEKIRPKFSTFYSKKQSPPPLF